MTRKSDYAGFTLTSNHPRTAAPDFGRQHQREQTLEWVSRHAFSTLRSTWCKAKLANNGIGHATGSPTFVE